MPNSTKIIQDLINAIEDITYLAEDGERHNLYRETADLRNHTEPALESAKLFLKKEKTDAK